MTQLPRFVGMTLNQWESILEIIAQTDDAENWNLSESIKDQIYNREEDEHGYRSQLDQTFQERTKADLKTPSY
tara:strand:- start:3899 stop:4117 length:219 start_codon:yes stop_codon:yes gene_type:complete